MCGTEFASLTLPDQAALPGNDENAEVEEKSQGQQDEADPNKASRGVYCDLFGGEAGPKVEKDRGKRQMAARLYECLRLFNPKRPGFQRRSCNPYPLAPRDVTLLRPWNHS